MLIVHACTEKYIENELHEHCAMPEHKKQEQELNTLLKEFYQLGSKKITRRILHTYFAFQHIINSCNHNQHYHYTGSFRPLPSFLGFVYQGNILHRPSIQIFQNVPEQLNSFFYFLFSFVVVILFYFMCFITEELLKIGKRDSSSIGISALCMFQRVQKVVLWERVRRVLKLHMIFFLQQMPRTISANKFYPAWKPNSATQYENARYTTINIFGIVSKLHNARHRHVKVMARTTKIIKEIKSQFVIHTIMFNSRLSFSHNKIHM